MQLASRSTFAPSPYTLNLLVGGAACTNKRFSPHLEQLQVVHRIYGDDRILPDSNFYEPYVRFGEELTWYINLFCFSSVFASGERK
jgi:hypothetical protein